MASLKTKEPHPIVAPVAAVHTSSQWLSSQATFQIAVYMTIVE